MQPTYTKIDDNSYSQSIQTVTTTNVPDVLNQREIYVTEMNSLQSRINAIDAQLVQAQTLGLQSVATLVVSSLPFTQVPAAVTVTPTPVTP